MDKIIEIRNFTKKYGDLAALDDLSTDIRLGKITGVLGPNASGKTSLLKALAGLLKADGGKILFDGKDFRKYDRDKLSYLACENFLYQDQSIADASLMFRDFYKDFDKEFFDKILAYFYINPKAKISTLSKGDFKKFALCLKLAHQADIYIFDEPLDGLDPISRAKIIDLIIDKVDEGKTFIISTHQIELMENLFDDVIFLARGALRESGLANDIRKTHGMDLNDFYDEIYLG